MDQDREAWHDDRSGAGDEGDLPLPSPRMMGQVAEVLGALAQGDPRPFFETLDIIEELLRAGGALDHVRFEPARFDARVLDPILVRDEDPDAVLTRAAREMPSPALRDRIARELDRIARETDDPDIARATTVGRATMEHVPGLAGADDEEAREPLWNLVLVAQLEEALVDAGFLDEEGFSFDPDLPWGPFGQDDPPWFPADVASLVSRHLGEEGDELAAGLALVESGAAPPFLTLDEHLWLAARAARLAREEVPPPDADRDTLWKAVRSLRDRLDPALDEELLAAIRARLEPRETKQAADPIPVSLRASLRRALEADGPLVLLVAARHHEDVPVHVRPDLEDRFDAVFDGTGAPLDEVLEEYGSVLREHGEAAAARRLAEAREALHPSVPVGPGG